MKNTAVNLINIHACNVFTKQQLSSQYVIVVPWVSRVYGICTLRAVICIPEGAGDLYHNTITNAVSYDKR